MEIWGHATQVVWAKTYTVGCGAIRQKSSLPYKGYYKTYFFCNYGPAGNLPGAKVYTSGQPGSLCPRGTKLETVSGLCA